LQLLSVRVWKMFNLLLVAGVVVKPLEGHFTLDQKEEPGSSTSLLKRGQPACSHGSRYPSLDA